MNRVKAQALFACLLIFSSFIVGLTVAQTPPPANTIQHGEGANMPTVTSQYGYFYGIPPVNITDRLFGDYTGLPLTGTTLDTGQGANELYDMDQNVLTTSGVTFATVNTGYGANELYEMNQDVGTWSNVTFNSVNATEYYVGPFNATDAMRYPVTEASYVVWSDGLTPSTYYAKNGMTGRLDYQGADAGPVINDALTAAAALGAYAGRRGSVVLVGNGVAFISSVAITARSNVDVICVGAEIVVDSAATVNGVNFVSVTNSVWRDVVVRRRDTAPIVAIVHAASFNEACSATLRIENCRFLNEVTAAMNGCYGIYVTGSASPTMTGCTGTGGAGGTNCYGIYVTSSASPTMTGCTGTGGKRTNHGWAYASANNGRYQPYATAPYILVGVYVQVTAAAGAGTVLDLGTSIAGNEIANNIPIDSTGAKYFSIANVEVAAAGYMYATPSAGIAEGSLSVSYVVMTNYATCYALYINTVGAARFTGGLLLANGASDAFYVTDIAEAANAWRLTDTHCETLDPVNQRSIISQSAYDPCPIYNCFLRGLVVNVVPPAGTAVGSNVQNADFESLTKEGYTDYKIPPTIITRWEQLVAQQKIPDTIRFTAKPLESLLEALENSKQLEAEAIIYENLLRAARNEELCRNAKSLKTLLLEAKTIKP